MTGWLPPGTTDKDIDDAAPKELEYRCDQCDDYFPVSLMIDIYDHEQEKFFIFCKECWEKRNAP